MVKLLSLPALGILFIGLVGFGIALIRQGLRGRRVGDHPVCCRCEFDLFGLPADQKVCPECGTALTSRDAVIIGHKQRRPALIYAGGAIVFLFISALVMVGGVASRQWDWQRIKPTALVAWEARRGDAVAWAELARRAKAGELSKERAQALTDDALAWQKDLTRVWKVPVGDFVEAARGAKLISDEQWATFGRQAPQFTLEWRAKAQPTINWLPGRVKIGPSRAGSFSRLSVRITGPAETDDPLFVQRKADGGSGSSETTLNTGGGSSMGLSMELDRKAVAAAKPGRRTTAVRVQTSLRENWQTTVSEWTETLSADWELVGKDEPTVEIIADDSPEARQKIETAIKVDKLEARPPTGGDVSISLNLKVGAIPVPLAYEVFARAAGGREWRIATVSLTGPVHYGTGGHVRAKDKFDADVVDLIFRPSSAVAERTVDITRMWNGEITIRNVAVAWPTKNTTQPASE